MNLIAFNRQLILKCFYIKVSFRLQHGKRIWQTKLCNVEIWIEEILTLPKARRVITEILLLLKYQKQIITAVLMGKMLLCCCYLLPLEDREYTKSYPVLSVWTLHRLGIKFLIGNSAGLSIMNFITESEIVNQPGLETNLSGNWRITSVSWQICQQMLLRKDESSSEKFFHRNIFFQTSWNPVRKRKA